VAVPLVFTFNKAIKLGANAVTAARGKLEVASARRP